MVQKSLQRISSVEKAQQADGKDEKKIMITLIPIRTSINIAIKA